MEKTILYSNNTHNEYVNATWYHLKNCQHQHCLLLIQQISKITRSFNNSRQFASQKKSKFGNNTSQNQNKQNSASYTSILEQIQVLKQNYRKAMKLLQHFQKQNDQLFEENQKMKSQMKNLKQQKTFNKKNNLQLQYSETKWSDNIDNIDGKHSFYTQTTHRLDHDEPSKLEDLELNFNLTPLEGSMFLQNEFGQKNKTHDQFYTQQINQQMNSPYKYNQNIKILQIFQTKNENQIKLATFQNQIKHMENKNKSLNDQIRKLKQMLKNRNSIQRLRSQLIQQLEAALT